MNFFNRATNAVETMGKNVSKAAKDNMEIMKCSSAIDSCKEKIELVYMEIGERYYNTEGEVSKEEFSDLFTEIENNQKQTSGKLRKLGESWKDAEHKKFEEKFTEYLNNMRPIISNIDEYCAFLERKANAADNYLKQR